jgi:glycosyltransferase involved in cell wall biosynthesis
MLERSNPKPAGDTEQRWPKISVITPSFNQAEFLEQTIRSVLLQGYPNLEYILLDGGSSDGSLEIIKKYSPWLHHWESRPDRGQSDAINRGLKAATGEIQCWLNSDDFFAPQTLFHVANELTKDGGAEWCVGAATLQYSDTHQEVRTARVLSKSELVQWTGINWFCQQSTFWRSSLIQKVGFLDESLHYFMDWDLWLRFYAIAPPRIIDQPLSVYRFHDNAKCVQQLEHLRVEEVRQLFKMVDAPSDGLLSTYREQARVRLGELLVPIDSMRGNKFSALKEFGSIELLSEVAKRVLRRIVPFPRSVPSRPPKELE